MEMTSVTWKYICEDSVEGILSGIFDAWTSGHGHANNRIEIAGKQEDNNLCLFEQEVYVIAREDKSERVLRGICQKISPVAADWILRALWSDSRDKGEVVYRYLIDGFREGRRILQQLTNPWAMRLLELTRNYGNELHNMLGFLRFHEAAGGSLFAVHSPKGYILPGLMAHFEDRLSVENFMIVDVKRGLAGIHPVGQRWFVRELLSEELQKFQLMEKEADDYQQLWKTFFQTMEITPRHNKRCQDSHCPVWYRDYMVEFQ